MPRENFADTYPVHGGEDIDLTQFDEGFAEAEVWQRDFEPIPSA